MRRLLLFPCILSLAGCANDLERLRALDPEANDFSTALAAEYLAYANSEAEQGHWQDAEHFAHKGMEAEQGKPVEPEKLAAHLSPSDRDALTVARKQLMATLTDDVKRVAPQKLARAQLLFDCWSHQVELKTPMKDDLVTCDDAFKSSFAEVQPVANSFLYGAETTHRLQFAPKSTLLNQENLELVKQIAHGVGADNASIVLEGHAAHRHRILLQRRLQAVKKALESEGVPAKNIRVKEPGDKAVILSNDTGNNDQIEIIIGQPKAGKK